ncbi:hypothetical protein XPA_001948 [Xanthoria parietina]
MEGGLRACITSNKKHENSSQQRQARSRRQERPQEPFCGRKSSSLRWEECEPPQGKELEALNQARRVLYYWWVRIKELWTVIEKIQELDQIRKKRCPSLVTSASSKSIGASSSKIPRSFDAINDYTKNRPFLKSIVPPPRKHPLNRDPGLQELEDKEALVSGEKWFQALGLSRRSR